MPHLRAIEILSNTFPDYVESLCSTLKTLTQPTLSTVIWDSKIVTKYLSTVPFTTRRNLTTLSIIGTYPDFDNGLLRFLASFLTDMPNLTSFTFLCKQPLIPCSALCSFIPRIVRDRLEEMHLACKEWSYTHMRKGLEKFSRLKKLVVEVHGNGWESDYARSRRAEDLTLDGKRLKKELRIQEVVLECKG
ncbi:hypothetical protein HDV00_000787 [Rhizophlyctis rosea]|nr:hypothetical protein HDV00_000787 [Rhizophlyctis rosea]